MISMYDESFNTVKALLGHTRAYLIFEALEGGLLEMLFKGDLEKIFFTLKHVKLEIRYITMQYIN